MINQNTVTLTLRWEEPFNNFSPIQNYTVLCESGGECFEPHTTLSNATRSHTVTRLSQSTRYVFLVAATNILGRGEPAMTNFTTPAGMFKCVYSRSQHNNINVILIVTTV